MENSVKSELIVTSKPLLAVTLEELADPSIEVKFLNNFGKVEEESRDYINKVIELLREAFNQNPKVLGIAAPQIGIKSRIFGIRFNDQIKFFIDPIITKKKDLKVSVDTFPQLPNKEILLARPEEIEAVYYNEDFNYEDNIFKGAASRLFDQLVNVLDGITPDTLGLVSDINECGSFFDLSDEEKLEAVKIYAQFVNNLTKELTEEIEKNPEDQRLYRNLRFTENVVNGRSSIIGDGIPANRAQRRAYQKTHKNKRR